MREEEQEGVDEGGEASPEVQEVVREEQGAPIISPYFK